MGAERRPTGAPSLSPTRHLTEDVHIRPFVAASSSTAVHLTVLMLLRFITKIPKLNSFGGRVSIENQKEQVIGQMARIVKDKCKHRPNC